MAKGPIPPLPALETAEETRATARAICAARCRERGATELAVSYERGEQDAGWNMRHEVARIEAEEGMRNA